MSAGNKYGIPAGGLPSICELAPPGRSQRTEPQRQPLAETIALLDEAVDRGNDATFRELVMRVVRKELEP
jgi:hypothetical protein